MQRMSRSSKLRSTAAFCAAVTLAGAPVALAQPADQGPQPTPPSAAGHLTAAQLRAIDGHQPREAVSGPAAPQSSGGGSADVSVWLITGGAAAALLATGGLARVVARRDRGPATTTQAGA